MKEKCKVEIQISNCKKSAYLLHHICPCARHSFHVNRSAGFFLYCAEQYPPLRSEVIILCGMLSETEIEIEIETEVEIK